MKAKKLPYLKTKTHQKMVGFIFFIEKAIIY